MQRYIDTLSIKDAEKWVSAKFRLDVSSSSIMYLIQYGQIRKLEENGETRVFIADLEKYYSSRRTLKNAWKTKLGNEVNWLLSFEDIREKERTKHVHRLHPYKGKFIPQLVEYFLDNHIDEFKREVFFRPGDTVLDPFCGSGTTLVQSNELGINAIGIDISFFNSLISNIKIGRHNIFEIQIEVERITSELKSFVKEHRVLEFESDLAAALSKYNNEHFPVPEYRYNVRSGALHPETYGHEHAAAFLPTFRTLAEKYAIKLVQEKGGASFLERWYLQPVAGEIQFVQNLIEGISNTEVRDVLRLVLSRTARSCRATTHADLGTLLDVVEQPYYCHKHFKICKPLLSILGWWERYTKDTIDRLLQFDGLRTDTFQRCLTGDSRYVDILNEIDHLNGAFASQLKNKRIKGIFSSPPYVGLIDYHEQHAYAYDLFGYERLDQLEIGPLFKGRGLQAQRDYSASITKVLTNCLRFLAEDCHVFLVANDKFGLYPQIAEDSGLEIVNEYKRPVLNRTEKDKSAYSETIFHMKRRG